MINGSNESGGKNRHRKTISLEKIKIFSLSLVIPPQNIPLTRDRSHAFGSLIFVFINSKINLSSISTKKYLNHKILSPS